MADVVFVHVGPPKTGTTYLQRRLYLNRASLGRHGIGYPTGIAEDMFKPALELVDRPWGGMRSEASGEWAGLVRRVSRSRGTAVISHEVLAGATADQAGRALGDLAKAEVHVVYTARDIARQVSAEWQERLKHRRRVTFAKFVRRVQRHEPTHGGGAFWQVQDLPAIHRRWASRMDPARVHLITVPPQGAAPGVLWQRFCATLGIDPTWAPRDTERINPSIGTAESTLLRGLNRRLEEAGLDSADYRALVRHVVVHETLANRPRAKPIVLPPEAADWADEVADRWIAWAEDSGVDVVGDLGDLRPVRLDPGARWRDPDRPRPSEGTSAALDALTAVILEASRRGVPEDRLVSRLTKVRDRIR